MSWVLFILASSLFNASWGALGKGRLGELSSIPFSFLFRGFVLLFYLPLFLLNFRTPVPPLFWVAALCSGLINAVMTMLLFEGIRKDFYSTYSLRHTTPIFTWILATIFLGETSNVYVISGILLTAIGSLLFYGTKEFSWYGLSCALLSGAESIFDKIGVDLSSPYTYPFVCYIITVLTLGILILSRGVERVGFVETASKWKSILPLSCLSFLAILTGFVALKMAPVSWVVPAGRIRVLFGFGLSYFCLREREGWRLRLLAGSIIVAGTLLIALKGTIS